MVKLRGAISELLSLVILNTFVNLYSGKSERCRANIGFLIDSSGSVKKGGWDTMIEFVLKIAKTLDIKEDETQIAVTKFSHTSELLIKFSEYTNYTSFENAVEGLRYIPGLGTNTDWGINVSLTQMFNENNGMRKSTPNALILMTDGDCTCACTASDDTCTRCKDFSCASQGMPCDCTKAQFRYWNKVFTEDKVPAIKLIGIGIEPLPANGVELIKLFVGKDDYYDTNIDGILDPNFIKELSVCDSKLHILSR